MENVLFSEIAFGRVTTLILVLIMDVFLLARRPNNTRGWLFFLHFFFMTLFNLGYFIAYSVYSPAGNIGWLIASFSAFAIAAQIQFGYRFPRKIARTESIVIAVISVAACMYAVTEYAVKSARVPMGLTENGYGSTYQSAIIPVTIAFLCLWRIIVFMRQTALCSDYTGRFTAWRDNSDAGFFYSLIRVVSRGSIFIIKNIYPKGKAARAARAFMILTFLEFILSIMVVLFATMHLVSEFSFNFVLNSGFLLIYFSYVIIYINRSPDAFSFIYKFIGITLVSILLVVSTVGYYSLLMNNRMYDELKNEQTKALSLQTAVLIPENTPADLSFLCTYAQATGSLSSSILIDRSGKTDRSKLRIDAIDAMAEGSRVFLQMHMTNFYCFKIVKDGQTWLAGYDYTAYRERVHKVVVHLILILVLTSLLVILLFPAMTYVSLIAPIRSLLQGVERVNNNDFDTPVPVHFEDEIGIVSRAFNRMVRSVHSNRKKLQEHTEHLEENVALRTAELQHTLVTLQSTQDQLIQTEKMASLGNLVAGIAHEINTPIGISLTGATLLKQKIKEASRLYSEGRMKKTEFDEFMKVCIETGDIIQNNIYRASELIQSFKRVAVDRSAEHIRRFNIKEYFNEVLMSLHPHLKKTRITVSISGDDTAEAKSDPGAYAQILTNLILNSVTHAFPENAPGDIHIGFTIEDGRLILTVTDNGIGIDPDILPHIFEPFVTTKRGSGGTGLGLHIVYNIVTQKLGGSIYTESRRNKGTAFTIRTALNLE